MPKSKRILVPGDAAYGYPVGTAPALFESAADGEASMVVLTKIGVGDTLEPINPASEEKLEAVRALLAGTVATNDGRINSIINLSNVIAVGAEPLAVTPTNNSTKMQLRFASGVASGAFVVEGTSNVAANQWATLTGQSRTTGSTASSFAAVSSFGYWLFDVSAFTHVRIRVTTVLGTGLSGEIVLSFSDNMIYVQAGSVAVTGTVVTAGGNTHGSTTMANPIMVAMESQNVIRAATVNATNIRPIADTRGRQIITDGQARELQDNNVLTLSTTTETTLIAAVASIFNDIRGLVISNTSATGTRLDLRDAVAGTIRFSCWIPPNSTIPIRQKIKQALVNTSWTVQLSVAVTDVRIFAQSERT